MPLANCFGVMGPRGFFSAPVPGVQNLCHHSRHIVSATEQGGSPCRHDAACVSTQCAHTPSKGGVGPAGGSRGARVVGCGQVAQVGTSHGIETRACRGAKGYQMALFNDAVCVGAWRRHCSEVCTCVCEGVSVRRGRGLDVRAGCCTLQTMGSIWGGLPCHFGCIRFSEHVGGLKKPDFLHTENAHVIV